MNKGDGNMTSTLVLESRVVPLTRLENGTYRVTGTRIPLERIIEEYKEGATPEEIVDAFDSLRLSDVSTIVAFYLDHKEEVEEYLREQDQKAEEVRQMIEAAQPPRPGLRDELLARKARMEADKNAQAGH
jgi:uncharacterized protein (DUF433 family)